MADKKLDPKIAEILKDHGYGPEAAWNCHGVWVVYHRVLEQIAAKGSIAFEPPLVLEANGVAKTAAICVTGRLGDKSEWSIGEAAPGNNKTAYPFAMAEKRAKDRVILKLIGLHGLVYSEEEADDFKAGGASPTPEPSPNEPTESEKRIFAKLKADLPGFKTLADMDAWRKTEANTEAFKELPQGLRAELQELMAEKRRELAPSAPAKNRDELRGQLKRSLAEPPPVNVLPAG